VIDQEPKGVLFQVLLFNKMDEGFTTYFIQSLMPESVHSITRGCIYLDINDEALWLAIGTRNGTFHIVTLSLSEGERLPKNANILFSHRMFHVPIRSISLHKSSEIPYKGWIACGGIDGSLIVCDVLWKSDETISESKKRKRGAIVEKWKENGKVLRVGDRKQKKNDFGGVTCIQWDPFHPTRLLASLWEGVIEVYFSANIFLSLILF
jgi:hypothetical protein